MEKLKDEEPADAEELQKKEVFLVKRKTIELNEFPKMSDLIPSDEAIAKSLSEEEEPKSEAVKPAPVENAAQPKLV